MARLPTVGGDNNDWGNVLNEYLSVSHNTDGTQKEENLVSKGFLTQTGTNDPVFVPIKDTIEGSWARTGVGTYTFTKSGAFVANKTIPVDDVYTDQERNLYKINRTDENTITLLTYASSDTSTLADGVLSNRFINIEVYN